MKITITADDIRSVETELELKLSDAERSAVLKEVESCDVQAGPGTGKTTLLTAKLAILAKKWPSSDRGICVLSHTNVARNEIERKLTRSPALRRLLRYPHFIGTIQTFVDQFLAIPYLRQDKVEVTAIDNELFGQRAWASLCTRSQTAKYAIMRYCKNDEARARAVVSSLRLDGARMGVVHSMQKANRFPGPQSTTGEALIATKESLRKEGYFRFDDMFAFAEACLFKLPYVRAAVRQRFPIAFVDELQDTNSAQDRVIEDIFACDECVLQRFGDKNQAIFDFESDSLDSASLFDRRKTLPVSTTYRFGNAIAASASRFTTVAAQSLNGNTQVDAAPLTMFLFQKDTIASLLPRFGDLVAEHLTEEQAEQNPVCVVGSRINKGNHQKDNFPAYLGDYFQRFASPKASKPKSPDTLLGYVIGARSKSAESRKGADAVHGAISGVLSLLRRAATDREKHISRSSLRNELLQSERLVSFQTLLWKILSPSNSLQESNWISWMDELKAILNLSALPKDALDFLSWSNIEAHDLPSRDSSDQDTNIYTHKAGDRSIKIEFNSVHAVKGQTHSATLFAETYAARQHDLKALLPVLTGKKAGDQLTGNAFKCCKRAFVAMTRPKHLLCLAMNAEWVSDSQAIKMRQLGWDVVSL